MKTPQLLLMIAFAAATFSSCRPVYHPSKEELQKKDNVIVNNPTHDEAYREDSSVVVGNKDARSKFASKKCKFFFNKSKDTQAYLFCNNRPVGTPLDRDVFRAYEVVQGKDTFVVRLIDYIPLSDQFIKEHGDSEIVVEAKIRFEDVSEDPRVTYRWLNTLVMGDFDNLNHFLKRATGISCDEDYPGYMDILKARIAAMPDSDEKKKVIEYTKQVVSNVETWEPY